MLARIIIAANEIIDIGKSRSPICTWFCTCDCFIKKETEVREELETSCVLLSFGNAKLHIVVHTIIEKIIFSIPLSCVRFLQNVSYYMGVIFKGPPPISCICITNIYKQYTSLRFIFTYRDSVLYWRSLFFLKWITIYLSYFLLSTNLQTFQSIPKNRSVHEG